MRSRRSHLLVPAALATLLVIGLSARPALANITGTTGAITERAAPTGTLNSNTLESDTTMYIWFERRVSGPGSLSLDHAGAGVTVNSGGAASAATLSPGVATSYVLHFDQAGNGSAKLSASVTFSSTIIGIWHTAGGLGGSDAQFAPTGLTYGNLQARRFELGTGSRKDRYSISGDGRTLTIIQARTVGNGVDQLRILVNPEPSSAALLGIGVVALGGLVGRRRSGHRRARRRGERTALQDV